MAHNAATLASSLGFDMVLGGELENLCRGCDLRYQAEGDAAFEPRSRRPKTSPLAIDPGTVELSNRVELRGLEPLAFWMQTRRSSS